MKPENIVISHGVCKVCDFGWAIFSEDRRQTHCGTLDYICPEIAEGATYDSGVDIWCLGVLVYEMLCGKTPFYNISRKKTVENIVNVIKYFKLEKCYSISQPCYKGSDRFYKQDSV